MRKQQGGRPYDVALFARECPWPIPFRATIPIAAPLSATPTAWSARADDANERTHALVILSYTNPTGACSL